MRLKRDNPCVPDANEDVRRTITKSDQMAGFHLLEVILAMAIFLAVMIIYLPDLQHTLIAIKVRNHQYADFRLLRSARQRAVQEQTFITVCPLVNQRCEPDWQSVWMTFRDPNDDRSFQSSSDEMIRQDSPLIEEALMTRQYSRRAVTFSPMGEAFGFNGTLIYCFGDHHSYATIISGSGRVRLATDSNHDGWAENSQKRPLRC